MGEKPTKFEIKEKGISGTIGKGGGIITASWYEWEAEDMHRVLAAMGKALGFPVVCARVSGGNGHYSAELRKATPEEATLQAKIAALPHIEGDLIINPPYPSLSEGGDFDVYNAPRSSFSKGGRYPPMPLWTFLTKI